MHEVTLLYQADHANDIEITFNCIYEKPGQWQNSINGPLPGDPAKVTILSCDIDDLHFSRYADSESFKMLKLFIRLCGEDNIVKELMRTMDDSELRDGVL